MSQNHLVFPLLHIDLIKPGLYCWAMSFYKMSMLIFFNMGLESAAPLNVH